MQRWRAAAAEPVVLRRTSTACVDACRRVDPCPDHPDLRECPNSRPCACVDREEFFGQLFVQGVTKKLPKKFLSIDASRPPHQPNLQRLFTTTPKPANAVIDARLTAVSQLVATAKASIQRRQSSVARATKENYFNARRPAPSSPIPDIGWLASVRASYSARLTPRPSWQPSLPTAQRAARDGQLPLDSAGSAGRRRCKARPCRLACLYLSSVSTWPVLAWPGLAWPVCLHRPPVSVPPTACPHHRPALTLGRRTLAMTTLAMINPPGFSTPPG